MPKDNVGSVYIKDLPLYIQEEIEYMLNKLGLSDSEVSSLLNSKIEELEGVLDPKVLYEIHGLVEDDYDHYFNTYEDKFLVDDYDLEEEDDFGEVIPDAYENILYIDFSPSGARYTLSGEFMGEPFEFTYGGSGEHVLEMIWNAIENLARILDLEYVDEYMFDEIYIDDNQADINLIVDDYYNEQIEDEQTVSFEPDFDEPEGDDY